MYALSMNKEYIAKVELQNPEEAKLHSNTPSPGKIFFKNGDHYEGSILKGLAHNQGKLVLNDMSYFQGEFDAYGLRNGTFHIFQGQRFAGRLHCDWFRQGTFYFKGGFRFRAQFGWSRENEQDKTFEVEKPVNRQITSESKFIQGWEIDLQRKRLKKDQKERIFSRTNQIRKMSQYDRKYSSVDKTGSAEDHEILPRPKDEDIEDFQPYNQTLRSTFSHCLQEDIPNTIEPILDEDFHKYLSQDSPTKDKQNNQIQKKNFLKNKKSKEKRLWVVLKGELTDKKGNLIFEYFDPEAYPKSTGFKHTNGVLEIRGESVVFYYGKEKDYGLILYPRTSVLGHACFYEGYIEYGKPSEKGVFVGANCRYLVHSLNKKGGGVIRCLNYCNMFPYTKTKVFEQGSVRKCTSLLANGFIFYGLDEYGKGFFKLYGLDRLIRGALNGADFKLEIAGDVVYQDQSGANNIDELLDQLRTESISDEIKQIKQTQELATISERTKSRNTFDSGSRKLANELFSIGDNSAHVNLSSKQSSNDRVFGLKMNSENSKASFEKLIRNKKMLPSSSEENHSRGRTSNAAKSEGLGPFSCKTENHQENKKHLRKLTGMARLQDKKEQNVKSLGQLHQNQNPEMTNLSTDNQTQKSQNKPLSIFSKHNEHGLSNLKSQRRFSRDSEYFYISDSSEQNRSKVNWYSVLNSEKSLGSKSKSQKSGVGLDGIINWERRRIGRGSLKHVASPVPYEGGEDFRDLARRFSRITGSVKLQNENSDSNDAGSPKLELFAKNNNLSAGNHDITAAMDLLTAEPRQLGGSQNFDRENFIPEGEISGIRRIKTDEDKNNKNLVINQHIIKAHKQIKEIENTESEEKDFEMKLEKGVAGISDSRTATIQRNLETEIGSIFEQIDKLEDPSDSSSREMVRKKQRRNSLSCRKELQERKSARKQEEELILSLRDNFIDEDEENPDNEKANKHLEIREGPSEQSKRTKDEPQMDKRKIKTKSRFGRENNKMKNYTLTTKISSTIQSEYGLQPQNQIKRPKIDAQEAKNPKRPKKTKIRKKGSKKTRKKRKKKDINTDSDTADSVLTSEFERIRQMNMVQNRLVQKLIMGTSKVSKTTTDSLQMQSSKAISTRLPTEKIGRFSFEPGHKLISTKSIKTTYLESEPRRRVGGRKRKSVRNMVSGSIERKKNSHGSVKRELDFKKKKQPDREAGKEFQVEEGESKLQARGKRLDPKDPKKRRNKGKKRKSRKNKPKIRQKKDSKNNQKRNLQEVINVDDFFSRIEPQGSKLRSKYRTPKNQKKIMFPDSKSDMASRQDTNINPKSKNRNLKPKSYQNISKSIQEIVDRNSENLVDIDSANQQEIKSAIVRAKYKSTPNTLNDIAPKSAIQRSKKRTPKRQNKFDITEPDSKKKLYSQKSVKFHSKGSERILFIDRDNRVREENRSQSAKRKKKQGIKSQIGTITSLETLETGMTFTETNFGALYSNSKKKKAMQSLNEHDLEGIVNSVRKDGLNSQDFEKLRFSTIQIKNPNVHKNISNMAGPNEIEIDPQSFIKVEDKGSDRSIRSQKTKRNSKTNQNSKKFHKPNRNSKFEAQKSQLNKSSKNNQKFEKSGKSIQTRSSKIEQAKSKKEKYKSRLSKNFSRNMYDIKTAFELGKKLPKFNIKKDNRSKKSQKQAKYRSENLKEHTNSRREKQLKMAYESVKQTRIGETLEPQIISKLLSNYQSAPKDNKKFGTQSRLGSNTVEEWRTKGKGTIKDFGKDFSSGQNWKEPKKLLKRRLTGKRPKNLTKRRAKVHHQKRNSNYITVDSLFGQKDEKSAQGKTGKRKSDAQRRKREARQSAHETRSKHLGLEGKQKQERKVKRSLKSKRLSEKIHQMDRIERPQPLEIEDENERIRINESPNQFQVRRNPRREDNRIQSARNRDEKTVGKKPKPKPEDKLELQRTIKGPQQKKKKDKIFCVIKGYRDSYFVNDRELNGIDELIGYIKAQRDYGV